MDTWNSHKWLWNPFHTPHFLQCSHPLCEMVSSIFSNEKKQGSRRLSAMLKRGKNIYHSALSACGLMPGIMLDACLTWSLLIFKTLWWDGASVIPILQLKKEINVEDKWVSWELKPLLVPCLMLVLLAAFPSLENCALSTVKRPCLWRVSATPTPPFTAWRRTCSGLTSRHIMPGYTWASSFSTQMYSFKGLIIVTSLFL